jgi:hypothetical protein
MDMQALSLFLKLVREDYKLSQDQIERLTQRMMSDEREFSRVWESYKAKARKTKKGVDQFQSILNELLS